MADRSKGIYTRSFKRKLQQEIAVICNGADLATLTVKKVRLELEKRFNVNLESRRLEIDELVMEFTRVKKLEEPPAKKAKKSSDLPKELAPVSKSGKKGVKTSQPAVYIPEAPPDAMSKRTSIGGTPSQYVKLNVGGSLHYTTIATLTKYDTMLSAMFSGRMEVLSDSEGWVLIDRCGKHFGTILNFMRDGNVSLPESNRELEELLAEARYYCIEELAESCSTALQKKNRDGSFEYRRREYEDLEYYSEYDSETDSEQSEFCEWRSVEQERGGARTNQYTRPIKLSPQLSALVGAESMPRHEVVKKVWSIIKEKNLYDPKNKQFTICDDALMTIIGTRRFRTFGIMKYLKDHFIS